jgi:hypothetical protein
MPDLTTPTNLNELSSHMCPYPVTRVYTRLIGFVSDRDMPIEEYARAMQQRLRAAPPIKKCAKSVY